jgi:hypothetical protein
VIGHIKTHIGTKLCVIDPTRAQYVGTKSCVTDHTRTQSFSTKYFLFVLFFVRVIEIMLCNIVQLQEQLIIFGHCLIYSTLQKIALVHTNIGLEVHIHETTSNSTKSHSQNITPCCPWR